MGVIFKRDRNGMKDFIAGAGGLTRAAPHIAEYSRFALARYRAFREREGDPKKRKQPSEKKKKYRVTSLAGKRERGNSARGGEPVEHGAHIVLIGNPDSRGVS